MHKILAHSFKMRNGNIRVSSLRRERVARRGDVFLRQQHKHKWTPLEDELLRSLVLQHQENGKFIQGATWATIAENLENRTAKQCRERYHHHLSPNIVRLKPLLNTEHKKFIVSTIKNNLELGCSKLTKYLTTKLIEKGILTETQTIPYGDIHNYLNFILKDSDSNSEDTMSIYEGGDSPAKEPPESIFLAEIKLLLATPLSPVDLGPINALAAELAAVINY